MRTTTRIVAALAASLILLSGCSASSTPAAFPQPAAPPMGEPAQDSAGGAFAPAPARGEAGSEASPYTTGFDRQIARSASMTVVADDVSATAERIRALAATFDGWVASESLALGSADGTMPRPAGSYLALSVPASRLDDAIRQVGELGTVRDRQAKADDVTDAVVDLDARIKSLEASVSRLQELVQRAGSVADIAAVERELSSRQADLEAMKSQRLRLAGAVERSTLTVALLTPTQSSSTNPILTGWTRGWNAFLESVSVLITLLAVLLPFLLVAAAIVVPIVMWRRRVRARRSASTTNTANTATTTSATPPTPMTPATPAPASPTPAELRLGGVDEPTGHEQRPDDQPSAEDEADHRP